MKLAKYPLPPELMRHIPTVCSRCLRPTAGPAGCVWCATAGKVGAPAKPLLNGRGHAR